GCQAAAQLYELCGQAGSAVRLRPASDGNEHLQHLAVAGLGAVLLPEHIEAAPPLCARPIVDAPVTRSVLLCAVGRRQYSPALDAFLRLLRARGFPSGRDLAA